MKNQTTQILSGFTIFLVILMLIPLTSTIRASSLSDKLAKKMDKELKKYLKNELFQLTPIDTINKSLSFNTDDYFLFALSIDGIDSGYVYVENAMGRYHTFTYMIIVNLTLDIVWVHVLQYDEEHGSEITNRKWLEQFIGLNPQSEIKYKDTIDAISGATISSKSITKSITNTLQKLKELKEKGYL